MDAAIRMCRHFFLLAGILGAFWNPALRGEVAPKPNVVVILMDDMGYGDIGPFGSKLNRTPELDRMAREGMKLTSFYCAPVCSASRAQLMTGCYFKRVGLGGAILPVSRRGIHAAENTVAELLKAQGYSTMIVGKWHLGDQPEFLPTRHGFDRFFGLPYSNDNDGDGKAKHNGVIWPRLPLLENERVIEAPPDQERLTQRYTEEAVKFITANKERPFFLYLAHAAVHVPLHPGIAFRGKSANGLYGDWVEESDWSVGRVLQALRDLNLDKKTLVLFTSDNGPWLGKRNASGVPDPLRGGKWTTWEGGLREPAIAWWPGRIPAGSVCDAITTQMDVLPTVVGLAGGNVPKDRVIDGKDIWPLLSGKSTESPHQAFYYFNGNKLDAVRSGPWKLVIGPQREGNKDSDPLSVAGSRESPRLYNLERDIGERADVAAENPQVVARLQGFVDLMDKDLGIGDKKGPGQRDPGQVENPQPLLMRQPVEYD